ncbi:hypothetical protein [Enterococcus rotai]|uniref:hypothetical protein n=1 Tax=Enterococcus rotai TaxID=118060 RepID=UPI0032B542C5
MSKTIGEVRSFLDSLIGKVTVDKSNSGLNGQCVSLVKNLLEFVGAPNPYAARGDAKDIPNTYASQGIAKVGAGTLNIAVSRNGGGGYGHVWVKIGSDSWQANWNRVAVQKNAGESSITDILNLDQWISTNNTPENGSEETTKKGEITMQCIYTRPQGEIFYFNGVDTVHIGHSDTLKVLRDIYRDNNGKEMPTYNWTNPAAPWFKRLEAVAPNRK